MKKFILMLMLLVTVGCSGPSNQDTCIPARSASDEKALDGTPIASAKDVDKKLREAKIITNIVEKLRKEVIGSDLLSFSGAKKLFIGFTLSPMVQNGIMGAFILYVILFGVAVIGGTINVTLGELVIRMIKVSFIFIFARNWFQFYAFIGSASLTFTDEMLGYFLNVFKASMQVGPVNISITENLFTKLDHFVASMFSMKMMAVLSALFLASGSSGPIYALLIGLAIVFVFKAIMLMVIVYCFSLFARAMLFAVAPIFITCLLFKPTQTLFDSWLRQLVNYSLQPVLVGAPIGIFLSVIQPFFQEFTKYQVCWQAIDSTREVYSWVFINPQTGNKVDFGANSQPQIELVRIMMFIGFSYIFYSATKLGQNMASALSGTVAGDLSSAAKGLGGVANYVGTKNSALGNALKQI